MNDLTSRFKDQNPLVSKDLWDEQIEPYARYHSGGLVVLTAPRKDAPGYVKLHDDWADNLQVLVHGYSPDDDLGSEDVAFFNSGTKAYEYFLTQIIETMSDIQALDRIASRRPRLDADTTTADLAAWARDTIVPTLEATGRL